MADKVFRSLLTQAHNQMRVFAFDEARATLAPLADPATEPESKDARFFWHDAAEVLRDAGMYEEAEAAWGRSKSEGVAADAAETETLAGYVLAGRSAEALERLAALAAKLPRNGVVRNMNAIALFECGDYGKALAEWEICRKVSAQRDCPLSTNPFYLALGAMALEGFLARNSNTPAVETASQPERAPGRTLDKRMAQIEKAWEEGRLAEALRWTDAEIADQKEPSDDLQMVRALVLGGMGRWGEARQEVSAVLQRSATNPSAQTYYAYCLVNSCESRIALELLDRVPPSGPDDYFGNYIRGCAWLGLGDRPRSAQAFRVAFAEYFFDSYHSVLIPAWKRTVRLLAERAG